MGHQLKTDFTMTLMLEMKSLLRIITNLLKQEQRKSPQVNRSLKDFGSAKKML